VEKFIRAAGETFVYEEGLAKEQTPEVAFFVLAPPNNYPYPFWFVVVYVHDFFWRVVLILHQCHHGYILFCRVWWIANNFSDRAKD